MSKPKTHLYFPNGQLKAELVHILRDGECPCKWEKISGHFTDGRGVYKKIL